MLIIHSFEDFDDNEDIDKDRVIAHLFKIIQKLDPETSYEDILMLIVANIALEDMKNEEDDFNVERN